jgi:hypothetical protein
MYDWTPNEFELLLGNGEIPSGRLAVRVHHPVASIDEVRSLVHAYHLNGNTSGLSSIMLERLALGDWTCLACGLYLPPARR